ncbi:hypothetical protein D3C75_595980 [compost metagenome]
MKQDFNFRINNDDGTVIAQYLRFYRACFATQHPPWGRAKRYRTLYQHQLSGGGRNTGF